MNILVVLVKLKAKFIEQKMLFWVDNNFYHIERLCSRLRHLILKTLLNP